MTDEMLDPQKLKALQAEVSKLPRTAEPPAEAWANIRTAISRESVAPIRAVRFWQQPAFLAAAAAALIVATTTVTLSLNRETAPVAAKPTASSPVPPFASQEIRYIQTANQLQSVVESPDSHLSPETIAKLKESIAIIDGAIAEARAALAADPANKELIDMLSSSYDKKLDLLRRSAAMGRS
jgi:hypothetical protein